MIILILPKSRVFLLHCFYMVFEKILTHSIYLLCTFPIFIPILWLITAILTRSHVFYFQYFLTILIIFYHYFFRSILNIIHPPHPFHLILHLEFFRHPPLFSHLLHQHLNFFFCFFINLIQMLRQFPGQYQILIPGTPVFL